MRSFGLLEGAMLPVFGVTGSLLVLPDGPEEPYDPLPEDVVSAFVVPPYEAELE